MALVDSDEASRTPGFDGLAVGNQFLESILAGRMLLEESSQSRHDLIELDNVSNRFQLRCDQPSIELRSLSRHGCRAAELFADLQQRIERAEPLFPCHPAQFVILQFLKDRANAVPPRSPGSTVAHIDHERNLRRGTVTTLPAIFDF